MTEAVDEPEPFSGLEEGVRPFDFGDDEQAVDWELAASADHFELDRSEDDTVFLAPLRDFSPAGMARDEGADADIESPFAEFKSKTAFELMSPVRRADGNAERSQQVLEAKASNSDAASALRRPARRKEPTPSTPPVSSPIDKPRVKRPQFRPPGDDPALARPRMAELGGTPPDAPPPSSRRRPPADFDEAVLPSIRTPALDLAISNTPPPRPAQAPSSLSRDDDAFPRRRQTSAFEPKTDAVPVGPPAPSRLRLALGAIANAGNICVRGARAAWTLYFRGCLGLLKGMGRAWALYSRGCHALQIQLSRLARWVSIQVPSLVRHSGAALMPFGRMSIQGCRMGGAYAWKATKALARHVLALTKALFSRASRVSLHAPALALSMQALAAEVFVSSRACAERWLAARAQRHRAAALAAKDPNAAKMLETAEALKTQARAVQKPSKASKASVTTNPAASSPKGPSYVETTTAKPASVDTVLARPRSRLSFDLGSRGLAISGLAAASIAFLSVAIALAPATAPANATLTFAIPEKPTDRVLPSDSVETIAADEVSGPDLVPTPDTVSTLDTEPVPDVVLPLPALDDPIAEMLDYIGDGERASPVGPDTDPVLAKARSVKGLSQFALAAELVGLKELLEPGAAYTIFAPHDEAFAKLAASEVDSLLEPAGHERLLTLLAHHVLPGRLNVNDLQGDVREYISLAGETVSIDATEAISVDGAGMVEVDLQADNSVLHVIDQVLPIAGP